MSRWKRKGMEIEDSMYFPPSVASFAYIQTACCLLLIAKGEQYRSANSKQAAESQKADSKQAAEFKQADCKQPAESQKSNSKQDAKYKQDRESKQVNSASNIILCIPSIDLIGLRR